MGRKHWKCSLGGAFESSKRAIPCLRSAWGALLAIGEPQAPASALSGCKALPDPPCTCVPNPIQTCLDSTCICGTIQPATVSESHLQSCLDPICKYVQIPIANMSKSHLLICLDPDCNYLPAGYYKALFGWLRFRVFPPKFRLIHMQLCGI
jgi:hypothetical protein